MTRGDADPWRVIVLGGGITGLSAALRMVELAHEQDQAVTITLVESSSQLGGKLQTLHREGATLELGADSFLARKEPVIRMCKKLGLDDQWVGTGPEAKRTWLAADGRLHPFPSGTYMGIPAWEEGILSSPFLSEQGKQRALEDLLIPDGSPQGDESIRTFLVRRFGEEMVDRIAEAVMSGIYGGRAEDLSLLATFPEFRQMERSYEGSVLRALQARMATVQRNASSQLSRSGVADSGQKGHETTQALLPSSVFLTLKSGLSGLIDALAKRLTDAGVNILLSTEAVAITDLGREAGAAYTVCLDTGKRLSGDAVIVTIPAFEAAKLLPDPGISAQLARIRYASVATVLLLYRARDLLSRPTGSGFVVPRREQTAVTAVTWLSSKWPTSTPSDVVAIRAFVGRSDDEEIVFSTDEEIVRRVRDDLAHFMADTLGQATPYDVIVTRWPQAMPQYQVGHLERIAALEEQASRAYPGLALAGAAYAGGVGIPDCIAQGEGAAERLWAQRLDKVEL